MKLFLALILIFSTLADFTSASVIDLENTSTCKSSTSCDDVDLHQESDREHEEENHEHHCHCHTGHSHTAVNYFASMSVKPVLNQTKSKYPLFQNGKTQNYHSDVIRPPIA